MPTAFRCFFPHYVWSYNFIFNLEKVSNRVLMSETARSDTAGQTVVLLPLLRLRIPVSAEPCAHGCCSPQCLQRLQPSSGEGRRALFLCSGVFD